jgi:hypothetical protein
MSYEQIDDMLPWFENWWTESGNNPLYAWKAMEWCFAHDLPLPSWAQTYFHTAAENMSALANGWDFRHPDKPAIEPAAAKSAGGEALGLWAPKSKNAFARLKDDADAGKAALDVDYAAQTALGGEVIHYSRNGVEGEAPTVDDVKRKFKSDVQSDRKDRIIKHGQALNRLR